MMGKVHAYDAVKLEQVLCICSRLKASLQNFDSMLDLLLDGVLLDDLAPKIQTDGECLDGEGTEARVICLGPGLREWCRMPWSNNAFYSRMSL